MKRTSIRINWYMVSLAVAVLACFWHEIYGAIRLLLK